MIMSAAMARTRIFISYAHADSAELAYKLRTDLSRQYDVWLDETGLRSGSNWSKELDDALRNSDVVLALLSKAASESSYCRGEQLWALSNSKCVIPLLVQADAERPTYIYALQYQDFSKPELYNLDTLVQAIENRSGASIAPPDPPENKLFFQVDGYDVLIKVEPVPLEKQEFKAEYGSRSRMVRSDNFARIRRSVSFSAKNICAQLFQIRYRTRNDGFIRPKTLHPNEAAPEEISRYEETGAEAIFKFTPQAGKTYTWEVEVYGGFDKGNRNLHFHLGKSMRCKEYRPRLDLSSYLAQGWKMANEPKLYFHPEDLGDHQLCAMRDLENPLAPVQVDPSGIWNWNIQNVPGGIVDVIWDLAEPVAVQAAKAGGGN